MSVNSTSTNQPIQNRDSNWLENTEGVDPGLLMMAVSMMHMDTIHNSAKAKLGEIGTVFSTLTKLASTKNTARSIQVDVKHSESNETQKQIEWLTTLQKSEDSRRVKDNSEPVDLPQELAPEQMEELRGFFASRNIEYKTVLIEKQEIEDGSDSENSDAEATGLENSAEECADDHPVGTGSGETKEYTIDQKSLQENLKSLQDYLGQLSENTADNLVTQQKIANHPDIARLGKLLMEFGLDSDVTTLSHLQATNESFESRQRSVARTIEQFLASAAVIKNEVDKLDANLSEELNMAFKLSDRENVEMTRGRDSETALNAFLMSKSQGLSKMRQDFEKAIAESKQLMADYSPEA